MEITVTILRYMFILIETLVVMITYLRLVKQYKYAVQNYNDQQHRKKNFLIAKKNNAIKSIISSNMTQSINIDDVNNSLINPILIFCLDGKKITEIPMNNEKLFIGRSKSDDIIINEPTISRSHCVITREDGRYFMIIDINKNPVKLNKKKIETRKNEAFKEEIFNGDIISMGDGRISFQFTIKQDLAIA